MGKKRKHRIKCTKRELVAAIIKVWEMDKPAELPLADKAWQVVDELTREPMSAAEVTGFVEDENEFEVFEQDLLGR